MARPASLLALLVIPFAATVALEARSSLELQRKTQPKEKTEHKTAAHEKPGHKTAAHDKAHDKSGHKTAAHGKDHEKLGHKMAAHDKAHEKSGHKTAGHDKAHEKSGHKTAAHDKAHEKSGHKTALHDKSGHKIAAHDKSGHKAALHGKAEHKHGLHEKEEHKVALHGKASHKSVAAHDKLKHKSALHEKAGHKSALHGKAGKASAKDKKKAGKASAKDKKKGGKAAAKDKGEDADLADPVEEVTEEDNTDTESPDGKTAKVAAVDDNSPCETPKNGTKCFNSVTWLRREGFRLHPEWYPAYGSHSSFEEVQAMLFSLGKSECSKACGQESTTAAPADPDSEEEEIGGTPRPAAGSTVHYDEESQDEPAEKQVEAPSPFKPDVVAEEETPAPAPAAEASPDGAAAAPASAETTPEPEPSGPPRPTVLVENPANSVDEEMLPRVGKDAAGVM